MMLRRIGLLGMVWLIGWMLTWPAVLADFQHGDQMDHCRRNLGRAMMFSAVPIAWPMSPFLTAFYEHGMQFGCPSVKPLAAAALPNGCKPIPGTLAWVCEMPGSLPWSPPAPSRSAAPWTCIDRSAGLRECRVEDAPR